VIRRLLKALIGVERFGLSKSDCTMARSNVADSMHDFINDFWPLVGILTPHAERVTISFVSNDNFTGFEAHECYEDRL
jgi:hypothetical protein